MVDYYIIWILYNNQLYYPILRTRATFALVHAFDLPLAPYVPLTMPLCGSHPTQHPTPASHHTQDPTIGTRACFALLLLFIPQSALVPL